MAIDFLQVFRFVFLGILLGLLFSAGVPLEALFVLGVLFVVFLMLRGHVWQMAEQSLERFFPSAKTWPEWVRKGVLFGIFVLILLVVKQVTYSALKLVGLDIESILLRLAPIQT